VLKVKHSESLLTNSLCNCLGYWRANASSREAPSQNYAIPATLLQSINTNAQELHTVDVSTSFNCQRRNGTNTVEIERPFKALLPVMLTRPGGTRPRPRPRPEASRPRPRPGLWDQDQGQGSQGQGQGLGSQLKAKARSL